MLKSKIPFIIVTGFLGSGKTTFIKRLLEQFAGNKKIGIIQNEYAGANIDTTDLKSTGEKFGILEINNGSVFCVCLMANFIDSLAAFIDEYQPEALILEASGLSDPIAIAELLQHEKLNQKIYLLHVWCIVDAMNYLTVGKMNERINRQIRIADTLIINKLDLGSNNLGEILNQMKSLNPYIKIIETSYCSVEVDQELFSISKTPVALQRRDEHQNITPFGRAEVNTIVLKTTYPITLIQLKRFISEVENRFIRMKGFVNLSDRSVVNIQSGHGHTEISDINYYAGPTELIGLGHDITPAEFGRRFHEIRKSS